nr:hypothetical protein [Micromonospora sp. DSM 115978]
AAVAAVGRIAPDTGPQGPPDLPHQWGPEESWTEDTTKTLWNFSKEFPGGEFPLDSEDAEASGP